MTDRLKKSQVKFHLDKVAILTKHLDAQKSAGEHRIFKMEEELKMELAGIQRQIDSHREKAEEVAREP